MGKCANVTKIVLRTALGAVAPVALQALGAFHQTIQTLSAEDPAFWTDHNKRAVALSFLKAEHRKATGDALAENLARMANEAILYSVNKASVALEDIAAEAPHIGTLEVTDEADTLKAP